MTDDLRTRIAAVLLDRWPAPVFRSAKQRAHIDGITDAIIAVIREFDMRPGAGATAAPLGHRLADRSRIRE